MKKFLEYVAEDIINKYGTDLSRIAVVFPNKRASIFLNEQLALKAQKPVWSPSYITISEFFRKHSPLTVGDPIKLVCDLHKSFTECTGISESLDKFFGWGQLLLSDFDDIDKNMAEASKVFINTRDLHELDDISYLTEEQRKIIKKFFSNFEDDNESKLKKKFMQLWCRLEDIYNDFKHRLSAQGIAYEGMMYREVAKNETLDYKYDMYLFVGFNVIQKVEQQVFTNLQKEGKARFYWDFDEYYMPDKSNPAHVNEAGHYISGYLKYFPNELDNYDDDIYGNLRKDKSITYISASTENIQARFVNRWLKENCRYKDGKRTAIVLCDESLLPTVIHCFPEEVESINITTGFPLFQTSISSYIIQLMELKLNGYSISRDTYRIRYVSLVLSHPYAMYLSEKCEELLDGLKENKIYNPTTEMLCADDSTTLLFGTDTDNKSMAKWLADIIKVIAENSGKENKDPLFQESVFRMYTLCNRIDGLIKSGDLDVDMITLQKFIIQLINSTSIPFHGEPAEGIQIMGILETRNLDFEHVLILSCNEGNMPKGVNDSSFIPHSIRKAYELTTVDNKVAIYAYYFYNLIQRAADVTIAYNNSTENGQTGEMSRFMLQLMVESNFNIKRISLKTGQQLMFNNPKEIQKDEKIAERLNSISYLSPTAINRYMRCPLQFYYNNIAQIKESDDNEEEEMSNRIFGNIFHEASELLYKKHIDTKRVITESSIEAVLKQRELIERIVDEAFNKVVFNPKGNKNFRHDYNGLQLINREVIIRYICRLLELDKSLTPFRIRDTEADVFQDINITTSTGNRTVKIGGRIDRLDQIVDKERNCERIRIIDYKTGSSTPRKINSVEEIFRMPVERGKHADYFLQTMLYSMIVRDEKEYNEQRLPVSPALLFIQHTLEDRYDPTISIGGEKIFDIAEHEKEFRENLKKIISEIFEPEIPFRPSEDKTVCDSCPYSSMCGI